MPLEPSVDTGKFALAMRQLGERVAIAGERGARQAAAYIEKLAKEEITGGHPRGTPTPSSPGEPPTNITGTLRRSISASDPQAMATGAYSVQVGPTVIYGRHVELGGPNWPPGVSYPYMRPAYEKAKGDPQLRRIIASAWAAGLKGEAV